ncbi:hypothetical protein ACFC3F_13655 [Microbacterium sp. NPDC055910]|uniref:hypothetical protein n=1 Tax=Microbacterium sp. NPDC055910 TaxID=3345659 RepID=UPI0035D842BB
MLLTPPATLVLAREHPALVRRRDHHRVRPGVYVDAAVWRALQPWDRYLLRVHAVAITWNEPVFCLESAAALHGLPTFGEARHIHLLSPDATTRRRGDVIVHGARDGRRIDVVEGVCATALTDTAVDLVRVLPPAFALAVADAALRHGGTDAAIDFSAAGRAQANRRGIRQLDWVQERATAEAESSGESVSRAVIEWLGYERPELQVEFEHDDGTDRVDFFFRTARVIGESDGYGKYDASNRAAMRAHFVREKKREDRLRPRVNGFGRWDWADTLRVEPLDAKLRAAGLAPVRPRHSSMLATLAANPRSLPPKRTRPVSSNGTSS